MNRLETRRVLVKISGEVLGSAQAGIDLERVDAFAAELRAAKETGTEIAVVVGGGNVLRGYQMSRKGVDRIEADYMGMLGTIINAVALVGALTRAGIDARVMTAIPLASVAEPFTSRQALNHLEKDRLIIIAGGTGNPYFTTDTAAALRAAEIKADTLLKGTKVDGIFSSDPVVDPGAKMIEELGYTEVLQRDLKVMDATAIALCRENQIPIIVFNIQKQGNLKNVLLGERIGTIVR
ncbi:MAG: UMP kinase [bacterium]|nr:MAG: UMP kinase [bacterium]